MLEPFDIESYSTKPKGRNRLEISLTLRNTDSLNSHTANVTVQLLDSAGGLLEESTSPTGSVGGGDTISLGFTFTGPNMVENSAS